MASAAQIEATYNYMDEIFRLVIGDHGDCTAAMYDGDFNLSLEEAQKAKHRYVVANLAITSGKRVLDIGCGWGPMLKVIDGVGARGVGLTISTRQQAACQRSGLDVRLLDWRDASVETLGRFNAVISIGSLEHFCSKEEFLAGQQERIYGRFFELCGDLLASGEKLFLQTMVWGGSAPSPSEISLRSRRSSAAYLVAVLERFYPGSWLPLGLEQLLRCARPWFDLVSRKNGRLDYIETMTQWGRLFRLRRETLPALLRMSPYLLADRDFRYRLETLVRGYNRECFVREVMDHERIVLRRN